MTYDYKCVICRTNKKLQNEIREHWLGDIAKIVLFRQEIPDKPIITLTAI